MLEIMISNAFCILILGVILLSIFLQKSEKTLVTKRFLALVYTAIAFFAINIACEMVEGKPEFTVFSYIANTLGYIAIDAIIIVFSIYVYAFIGTNSKKTKIAIATVMGLCMARVILLIVLVATGRLFTIDNGVFIPNEDEIVIPYMVCVAVMILLLTIVIVNHKHFTKQQFAVIIIYQVIPVPAAFVELYTAMYSLTSMVLTLSILLIYVLIQVDMLEKGKVRETVLKELSATDLLTRVNNRRAYYDKITGVGADTNIGVMFSDINNLKYTNDHFGHRVGDELIQKYAKILVDSFGNESVFRISGDEFVVILENISVVEYRNYVNEFRITLDDNNQISSFGSAYGSGSCINTLITEAESDMYENKRAYHESIGR